MKKQELVHLHGLLVEVQRDCAPRADLEEYDSLQINASSIYRRKNDHRAAVFALIEAITDDLPDERTTVTPPSTL